jgi:2-polyprenyl-6-methoxyphenol hydroxylase-like FAD-dependent oxidoreductase
LLAFLLARGGVRVTLIERHRDFGREFRGEGLAPSGMAAIREAGLWDDFQALPATVLKSMALYADNRPFLELSIADMLPSDMSFIRVMAQQHLLELLVGKSSEFENFALLRGTVVREAILSDGRVTGVRVSDESGNRDIDADYVIASDGRFSSLRKQLGIALEGQRQVFDVVWCKIPRPAELPQGRVYSFLRDDFFGLVFPTENDQLQIGRIIAKGSYRQLRNDDKGDWFSRVVEIIPPSLQPMFAEQRNKASDPALLDVVCGSMRTWSAPGICFIGDAAHPMSPIGAQGINIALRDALVAANHLGPPLADGAPGPVLDSAATAFETERRKEVDKIQQQQTDAPRRFKAMRSIAPVIRAIPARWVAGLARRVLGLRATRNFIEGSTALRLRFGPIHANRSSTRGAR